MTQQYTYCYCAGVDNGKGGADMVAGPSTDIEEIKAACVGIPGRLILFRVEMPMRPHLISKDRGGTWNPAKPPLAKELKR
jgi:hypothetical protein